MDEPKRVGHTVFMLNSTQKFLNEVNAKFEAMGHKAGFGWSKKRRYGMHCTQCGAHVFVTVTTKTITEFPQQTCEERLRK